MMKPREWKGQKPNYTKKKKKSQRKQASEAQSSVGALNSITHRVSVKSITHS